MGRLSAAAGFSKFSESDRVALSAITNGNRLHTRCKDGGVDGRSSAARRFKDLVRSFSADFGGYDALTEAQRSLVRQAATVTIRAEQLQEDVIRGARIDPDELIRLTNTSRRCLISIRRASPRPTASGLHGYLRDKRAGGGA